MSDNSCSDKKTRWWWKLTMRWPDPISYVKRQRETNGKNILERIKNVETWVGIHHQSSVITLGAVKTAQVKWNERRVHRGVRCVSRELTWRGRRIKKMYELWALLRERSTKNMEREGLWGSVHCFLKCVLQGACCLRKSSDVSGVV